jgi:histidinol dehydrogenase
VRVVRGYEAGKEALSRGLRRHWDDATPAMLDESQRLFGERLTPREAVARILAAVRDRGDDAVRDYAALLDGATPSSLESLEIPREEWKRAYKAIPASLKRSLDTVARRVRAFHQACMPRTWVDFSEGFGELYTPLERVGVYVPGGRASYPSTVMMTAIPARVAGVEEIILVTPGQGSDGPSATVLAAAHVAGVDRLFQIGGAQAIAALAYGTEQVPRVDMVCGPGNLFVTLAKQMVYGHVAVDGLYGPTETVVVADEAADPALCAADLIAQAEHDPLASPIFITTSEALWGRVEREVERQLAKLPKREVAEQAFDHGGMAVVVDELEQAVSLANLFAPEHLCLMVREPWKLLAKVRHAGGVFVGEHSPEVMGDYVAGPSHVMPTGGTARFSSPLGVHQFLKVSSLVTLSKEIFDGLVADGVALARAEGLEGHARAMTARGKGRRTSRAASRARDKKT